MDSFERAFRELSIFNRHVLQMNAILKSSSTLKYSPAICSGRYLWRQRYTTMANPAVAESEMATNGVYADRRSLAIPENEDDLDIRQMYRPFIRDDAQNDWVSALELTKALNLAESDIQVTNKRLKVLVLYGSLRKRSYSKLVAYEASRILFRLGCDVRVFDPEGLPVKNDVDHGHAKVQELRALSTWSDGQLWVSPEQHGNLVRIVSPASFRSSELMRDRPLCSRIKLIGYPLALEVYAQHKAGHSPSPRCAVVPSPSMQ